jgi:threonine/homoserine/homoserine lactone efflux protein
MIGAPTIALFALAAAITVVTPGPTVLLALSHGSRHGMGGAAPGIAGALLSDVLLIAAAALGLGSLLAASDVAFSVLKVLGACYLAWLGLCLLKQPPPSPRVGERDTARQPAAQRFRRSLLVALGNPKGLLFFSALLPQFIEPTAPLAAQYATLGLIFVLIDGATLAAYALLGARWVSRLGSRWITSVHRSCGAVLMALAAALAAAQREGS